MAEIDRSLLGEVQALADQSAGAAAPAPAGGSGVDPNLLAEVQGLADQAGAADPTARFIFDPDQPRNVYRVLEEIPGGFRVSSLQNPENVGLLGQGWLERGDPMSKFAWLNQPVSSLKQVVRGDPIDAPMELTDPMTLAEALRRFPYAEDRVPTRRAMTEEEYSALLHGLRGRDPLSVLSEKFGLGDAPGGLGLPAMLPKSAAEVVVKEGRPHLSQFVEGVAEGSPLRSAFEIGSVVFPPAVLPTALDVAGGKAGQEIGGLVGGEEGEILGERIGSFLGGTAGGALSGAREAARLGLPRGPAVAAGTGGVAAGYGATEAAHALGVENENVLLALGLVGGIAGGAAAGRGAARMGRIPKDVFDQIGPRLKAAAESGGPDAARFAEVHELWQGLSPEQQAGLAEKWWRSGSREVRQVVKEAARGEKPPAGREEGYVPPEDATIIDQGPQRPAVREKPTAGEQSLDELLANLDETTTVTIGGKTYRGRRSQDAADPPPTTETPPPPPPPPGRGGAVEAKAWFESLDDAGKRSALNLVDDHPVGPWSSLTAPEKFVVVRAFQKASAPPEAPPPPPAEPPPPPPPDFAEESGKRLAEWRKAGMPKASLSEMEKIEAELVPLYGTRAAAGRPDAMLDGRIGELEASRDRILEAVNGERAFVDETLASMTPEQAQAILDDPEGKSPEAVAKAQEVLDAEPEAAPEPPPAVEAPPAEAEPPPPPAAPDAAPPPPAAEAPGRSKLDAIRAGAEASKAGAGPEVPPEWRTPDKRFDAAFLVGWRGDKGLGMNAQEAAAYRKATAPKAPAKPPPAGETPATPAEAAASAGPTPGQIRAFHAERKRLGLDTEDYRAALEAKLGTRSLRAVPKARFEEALAALREYAAKKPKEPSAGTPKDFVRRMQAAADAGTLDAVRDEMAAAMDGPGWTDDLRDKVMRVYAAKKRSFMSPEERDPIHPSQVRVDGVPKKGRRVGVLVDETGRRIGDLFRIGKNEFDAYAYEGGAETGKVVGRLPRPIRREDFEHKDPTEMRPDEFTVYRLRAQPPEEPPEAGPVAAKPEPKEPPPAPADADQLPVEEALEWWNKRLNAGSRREFMSSVDPKFPTGRFSSLTPEQRAAVVERYKTRDQRTPAPAPKPATAETPAQKSEPRTMEDHRLALLAEKARRAAAKGKEDHAIDLSDVSPPIRERLERQIVVNDVFRMIEAVRLDWRWYGLENKTKTIEHLGGQRIARYLGTKEEPGIAPDVLVSMLRQEPAHRDVVRDPADKHPSDVLHDFFRENRQVRLRDLKRSLVEDEAADLSHEDAGQFNEAVRAAEENAQEIALLKGQLPDKGPLRETWDRIVEETDHAQALEALELAPTVVEPIHAKRMLALMDEMEVGTPAARRALEEWAGDHPPLERELAKADEIAASMDAEGYPAVEGLSEEDLRWYRGEVEEGEGVPPEATETPAPPAKPPAARPGGTPLQTDIFGGKAVVGSTEGEQKPLFDAGSKKDLEKPDLPGQQKLFATEMKPGEVRIESVADPRVKKPPEEGRSTTLGMGLGGFGTFGKEPKRTKAQIRAAEQIRRRLGLSDEEYGNLAEITAPGKRSVKEMTEAEAHEFIEVTLKTREQLAMQRARQAAALRTMAKAERKRTDEEKKARIEELTKHYEGKERPPIAPWDAEAIMRPFGSDEPLFGPVPLDFMGGPGPLSLVVSPLATIRKAGGAVGVEHARMLTHNTQKQKWFEERFIGDLRAAVHLVKPGERLELVDVMEGKIRDPAPHVALAAEAIDRINRTLFDLNNWVRVNRLGLDPILPRENYFTHIREGYLDDLLKSVPTNSPEWRIVNNFLKPREGQGDYRKDVLEVLEIHAKALIRDIVWKPYIERTLPMDDPSRRQGPARMTQALYDFILDTAEYAAGRPSFLDRWFRTRLPAGLEKLGVESDRAVRWVQNLEGAMRRIRPIAVGWFISGNPAPVILNFTQAVLHAFHLDPIADRAYLARGFKAWRTDEGQDLLDEMAVRSQKLIMKDPHVAEWRDEIRPKSEHPVLRKVEGGAKATLKAVSTLFEVGMIPFSWAETWNRSPFALAAYYKHLDRAKKAGLADDHAHQVAMVEAWTTVEATQASFTRISLPPIYRSEILKAPLALTRFGFLIWEKGIEHGVVLPIRGLRNPKWVQARLRQQLDKQSLDMAKKEGWTAEERDQWREKRFEEIWPLYAKEKWTRREMRSMWALMMVAGTFIGLGFAAQSAGLEGDRFMNPMGQLPSVVGAPVDAIREAYQAYDDTGSFAAAWEKVQPVAMRRATELWKSWRSGYYERRGRVGEIERDEFDRPREFEWPEAIVRLWGFRTEAQARAAEFHQDNKEKDRFESYHRDLQRSDLAAAIQRGDEDAMEAIQWEISHSRELWEGDKDFEDSFGGTVDARLQPVRDMRSRLRKFMRPAGTDEDVDMLPPAVSDAAIRRAIGGMKYRMAIAEHAKGESGDSLFPKLVEISRTYGLGKSVADMKDDFRMAREWEAEWKAAEKAAKAREDE